MLDENEYAIISAIHSKCIKAVKQYRQENNTSLEDTPLDKLYLPVLEAYAKIVNDPKFDPTEFDAFDIVRRHRLNH